MAFLARNERGSSLVQVLIGIALMGVLTVVASRTTVFFARSIQHAEMTGNVRDLRDYVGRNIDCSAIVGSNAAACAAGGYVRLVDKRTGTCENIAPAWPHQTAIAGEFFVRARCTPAGNGSYTLAVEYAVGKASGAGIQYKKDPTTGTPKTFAPLFESPISCSSAQVSIPTGWSARSFLNASPNSGITMPESAGMMVTELTLLKLCDMVGYPQIVRRPPSSKGYSSCSNNQLAFWDGTKFQMESACRRNKLLWNTADPLVCARSLSTCP